MPSSVCQYCQGRGCHYCGELVMPVDQVEPEKLILYNRVEALKTAVETGKPFTGEGEFFSASFCKRILDAYQPEWDAWPLWLLRERVLRNLR